MNFKETRNIDLIVKYCQKINALQVNKLFKCKITFEHD